MSPVDATELLNCIILQISGKAVNQNPTNKHEYLFLTDELPIWADHLVWNQVSFHCNLRTFLNSYILLDTLLVLRNTNWSQILGWKTKNKHPPFWNNIFHHNSKEFSMKLHHLTWSYTILPHFSSKFMFINF